MDWKEKIKMCRKTVQISLYCLFLLLTGRTFGGQAEWIYPGWERQTAVFGTDRAIAFPLWTESGLKRLSSVQGLSSLHRDLALVCEETTVATDAAAAFPDCRAFLVDKAGFLNPLGRHDLLAAQRLPGNGMLYLTRDLSLVVSDRFGAEKTIAMSVAGPRISDDGKKVIFTQYPEGTRALLPGTFGKLMSMDLTDGKTRTVTEDIWSSCPFAVPGSQDVLFISSRTGLASFWLASPGKPDVQITNRGKKKVDSEFIPVPGRELVWIPGCRKAVFTAHYGSHALWSVSLETGRAERLGPGRMPSLSVEGMITALDDDGGKEPFVVYYDVRRLP